MAFETFDRRRLELVNAALEFVMTRYGRIGLKKEAPIDAKIRWRPTFHLKKGSALIAAFEYNDMLYPAALDVAIVDILSFDRPIVLYQLCPLSSFQGDKHQARTRLLADKGIGIITIDDDTMVVTVQKAGVPLAQHIREDEFSKKTRGLGAKTKAKLRSAFDSFGANVGQGLQEAGQIVEAMVRQLHAHAIARESLAARSANVPPALMTDKLYGNQSYARYRSVLGRTRSFIERYRNVVSHPQRSAKEAIEKIRQCRSGFLEAIEIVSGLSVMAKEIGCRLRLW